MLDVIKNALEQREIYRPLPFWSWNDKLDVSILKEQVRWMQEVGMGGFFMHARSGLQTEYLSEEWMQDIKECAKEAKRLGMEAWIYDENGWPSGFVGGKLLTDIENRDQYILHSIGAFDEQADVSYLLEKEDLIRIPHGEKTERECLNLYIRTSESTVDILNPEVTNKFLAETHQKYQEMFGEAFSQQVRGFFTDEPQYYRWKTPYTPMIAKYFMEVHQEEILDKLGLLFVEKEGYRSFRYHYWLGMQKLMLTHFAKKIYDWCEEHRVCFTGHYIEERALGFQVMCCGGIMPFYEYQHIPGIDWLNRITDNELSARQVGSVARQLGRKQVISETFAGCGWDTTPAQLSRIAGFQFANGVNMVCHHLVPYSERGQRKRDYPTHFTRLNPWVKEEFRKFNDYLTNLGCILAEAEEPVNVAVLHPIRSAYFDYKREDPQAYIMELEEEFSRTLRMLSRRGVSYHLLDETLLEKYGFAENGQIGCGKCVYDYLILPKLFTMGRETERLLQRYVETGGKVLLLCGVPQYLEGEPFSYTYLQSNCTLEDIVLAQPFRVGELDTELYYTYRILDGKPLVFVQNGSGEKGYSQTFSFSDKSRSFLAVDLITMQEKRLPLTVSLEPDEALLLFPEMQEAPEEEAVDELEFQFADAMVSFDENYLTIDTVSYSKDGAVYSKPMLVYELFQKLLRERYQGKLWLKYDFEIQTIPEKLSLIAEYKDAERQFVNGQEVSFTGQWEDDPNFQMADIKGLVRLGINSYEIMTEWFQSERTYYALFGENVTESLKNCIAYDSEIEAVYLSGRFGVYSRTGFTTEDKFWGCARDFYIGKVPEKVTELVDNGFPFFRGNIRIFQNIQIDASQVRLSLPGHYLTARVWINGKKVGDIFLNRKIDISRYVCKGNNLMELEFTIGNQNFFGPLHLENTNRFIGVHSFEEYTFPREENESYLYKLRRFQENR